MAVTLEALFQGKTTMWEGVNGASAVVLFFVFMSIVGFLEGMQIAFFAVTKMTKDQQGDSKCAKMTCDLLFKGKGRNLPGFMIGRQLCVTLCFFIIARVTTLDVSIGVDQNIFDVSDGIQEFFNTGLLGALITTILGSIAWQLVASAFPIGFLSIPLTYALLVFCLALEATGIVSGAWVVAKISSTILARETRIVGGTFSCLRQCSSVSMKSSNDIDLSMYGFCCSPIVFFMTQDKNRFQTPRDLRLTTLRADALKLSSARIIFIAASSLLPYCRPNPSGAGQSNIMRYSRESATIPVCVKS